ASVHPEPGSNSLNNCLTQDNLWLSFIPHYCFGSFKPFLNVKNFQVLCVLLFSYQGSLRCSLRVSLIILPNCFSFVKNFFKVFSKFLVHRLLFETAYLFYQASSALSRVFLFYFSTLDSLISR